MALHMTLRKRDDEPNGLAPAGPMRDWQAEQRRAVAKATANALADCKPEPKLAMTQWKKGDASDAYNELKRDRPLPIVLKAPSVAKQASRPTRCGSGA
eukprot:48464-Prymnesium_polylepis.1